LALFQQWAKASQWKMFHTSHYDWWMFPIDDPSRFGFAWTVYEGDIAELKKDAAFLERYLRGAELLAASWGWDLYQRRYLPNPTRDQCWQHWPIRLYKASKSLKLFGYDDHFESMKQYANDLLRAGESMNWNGKDLSKLFK
jgi:hypothetical protein